MNFQMPDNVDEAVRILKSCDEAYFNGGESPLSDRDYDAIKRAAFLESPSHEYFVQIGAATREGKTKLPYTMGSLNQIYENEISKWISEYELKNKDIVITDKLDGVSCMLVYNNGALSIAYSRGDGIYGADITRHIRNIPSVPLTIPDINYLVVRCEIIMAIDVFEREYATEYKNPRNMVAGVLNKKTTELSILKNLDAIAYEIVAGDADILAGTKLKSQALQYLKAKRFAVVPSTIAPGGLLSDQSLSETLAAARKTSRYELDGLVLTVDEHANLKAQRTANSLNPEHSVKYKVLDASSVIETVVKDVHWEISKSGFIKPTIEIAPIELFGTTVTFASGYNARFIISNAIGPGARVTITKAGMVIPQVLSILSGSPLVAENTYNAWINTKLNILVGVNGWEWNQTEVELVVKNADNNDAVIFKRVLSFFNTYKVDLLKEATLQRVCRILPSKSYTDIIIDLCDMAESEWVKCVGVNGSRIYASLHNRMTNSTLETFLGAVTYMGAGFGVRRAKMLLAGIADPVTELPKMSLHDIMSKDGFDEKTANAVISGLPHALRLLDILMRRGVLKLATKDTTSELAAVNVVMTGFRDSALQETIESMGGTVSSSVSKKTTHLLCMDTASRSSKMKKAIDMGVQIMSPDQFRSAYAL